MPNTAEPRSTAPRGFACPSWPWSTWKILLAVLLVLVVLLVLMQFQQ